MFDRINDKVQTKSNGDDKKFNAGADASGQANLDTAGKASSVSVGNVAIKSSNFQRLEMNSNSCAIRRHRAQRIGNLPTNEFRVGFVCENAAASHHPYGGGTPQRLQTGRE